MEGYDAMIIDGESMGPTVKISEVRMYGRERDESEMWRETVAAPADLPLLSTM